MKKESIAVIIPAYNEAQTIRDVVRVARSCELIDEVIVVSDGSTDETVSVAKSAGARTIVLQENLGKGGAMLKGVSETRASIIVFLDADLIGLTVEHLESLIQPVLDKAVSMQVGIRDRGVVFTQMTHWFPLISGERALRREVAEGIPRAFYKGYMIEIAFNYFCRIRDLLVGTVYLRGLSIRRKYEKVGWPKAVVQYARMTRQIFFAHLRVRFARIIGKF